MEIFKKIKNHISMKELKEGLINLIFKKTKKKEIIHIFKS